MTLLRAVLKEEEWELDCSRFGYEESTKEGSWQAPQIEEELFCFSYCFFLFFLA